VVIRFFIPAATTFEGGFVK